jgi:hypothetical protein
MKQLTEACPRFQRCAVNDCPLHAGYGGPLEALPADAEQRCRLSKMKRLAVVARYPDLSAKLRNGGLTPREQATIAREARLTDAQKEARRERGRQMVRQANRPFAGGSPEGKVGQAAPISEGPA